MDNIDVEYARSKGINVINTPAASSSSVAELVFAHLYGGVRFLHESNRNQRLEPDVDSSNIQRMYGFVRVILILLSILLFAFCVYIVSTSFKGK